MPENNSRNRWSLIFSEGGAIIISSLIAGFGAILAASVSVSVIPNNVPSPTLIAVATPIVGLNELNNRVNNLEESISIIATTQPENITTIQIADIQSELDNLSQSFSTLEAIILEEPAEALELTLLRRDLDNLETRQIEAISNIQNNVNQFVAITAFSVLTLALGILGEALRARWNNDPEE